MFIMCTLIYSYVNYSNIAARVLRRSLKSPEKDEASKRDVSHIKVHYWAEGSMLREFANAYKLFINYLYRYANLRVCTLVTPSLNFICFTVSTKILNHDRF